MKIKLKLKERDFKPGDIVIRYRGHNTKEWPHNVPFKIENIEYKKGTYASSDFLRTEVRVVGKSGSISISTIRLASKKEIREYYIKRGGEILLDMN
jgi:hypothetical protein